MITIKELRQAAGLTQRELAIALNLTDNAYISREKKNDDQFFMFIYRVVIGAARWPKGNDSYFHITQALDRANVITIRFVNKILESGTRP